MKRQKLPSQWCTMADPLASALGEQRDTSKDARRWLKIRMKGKQEFHFYHVKNMKSYTYLGQEAKQLMMNLIMIISRTRLTWKSLHAGKIKRYRFEQNDIRRKFAKKQDLRLSLDTI